MSKRFKEYAYITRGFFLIRFLAALSVGIIYILIAAGIQYTFIDVFGESTFNYLVGGLLSLFLGVFFCHYIGSLAFMFVKGWHVSALAYVSKIKKSGASAIDVGVRAFAKNLISFGAVYTVKTLLNNVLVNFKDKLWELLDGLAFSQIFIRVSTNPVAEYFATDILNYGFDATIFYLIKHPSEDMDDVPSVVLTAVKKYLYCLPDILLTSLKTFVLFKFLPKIIACLFLGYIFISRGILASILISVLMYPVFYILDNSFFDPLTMIMFISVYSKKCDEELEEDNPIIQVVENILAEDDLNDTETDNETEKSKSKRSISAGKEESSSIIPTAIASAEELFGGKSNKASVINKTSLSKLKESRSTVLDKFNNEDNLSSLSQASSMKNDSSTLNMDELEDIESPSVSVNDNIEYASIEDLEFAVEEDLNSNSAATSYKQPSNTPSLAQIARGGLQNLVNWDGGDLDEDPLSK